MKIITVVSGKGGVGKSTVGAVFIHLLSSKLGKDKVIGIEGFKCSKGKKYALQEYKDPRRVLTATVRTAFKNRPLLPVRSSDSIPKKLLVPCMRKIAEIEVDTPIKINQIISS